MRRHGYQNYEDVAEPLADGEKKEARGTINPRACYGV